MAASAERGGGWRRRRWRIAAWTGAALMLLLPLVAMQFTDEVNWSETDFIVAGALIGGTGLTLSWRQGRRPTTPIGPLSALRSRPRSSSSG